MYLLPISLPDCVTQAGNHFPVNLPAVGRVTRKFIRCRNAEIRTISAIKHTACYALAILVTVMVKRVIHFDDGLFFTVYIQILYSKMG
jgi:hypothetical protein